MACFFSRPVPLWVAPEDCPSPFRHIICIFLRHPTNVMSLPVSSFLAAPSSASFSQYKHLLSSVHVQATSVLTLVFSLQTVPPECMRTGVSVQLAYVRFCTNRRTVLRKEGISHQRLMSIIIQSFCVGVSSTIGVYRFW